MALSFVQYTGDGSTTTFAVPFPYIAQSHIQVKVDGVLKTAPTDYTFPTTSTLQFPTAPLNGLIVEIRRVTPRIERLVDFQDASTLTEATLDQDSNQNFFVAQEAFDLADSNIKLAPDNTFDAEGLRIKNLGAPKLPTDAVRVQDLTEDAGSVQLRADLNDTADPSKGVALIPTAVKKSGDSMTGPLTVPQLTSSGLLTGDTLTYTRSKLLAANTDLNTVLTAGFYDGQTLVNAPGTGWWYITVQRHSNADTYVVQTARELSQATDRTYVRARKAGTWGAWAVAWTAANDGADSGLDADLLDGMQPATAATASTIAQRDGAGALAVANATAAAHAVALGQFVTSLASNGYIKLPGGLIVQWGNVTLGNFASGAYAFTATVTYPIAFPNAVLHALCSKTNDATSVVTGSRLHTATSMQVYAEEWVAATQGPNANLSWLVMGY